MTGRNRFLSSGNDVVLDGANEINVNIVEQEGLSVEMSANDSLKRFGHVYSLFTINDFFRLKD